MSLQELLSGSDIRGFALPGDNGEIPNLTDEVAYKIGVALPKWFKNKFNKDLTKVSLGRDSRVTGENLLNAVAAGLNSEDINVLDNGLSTTPSMFMILQKPEYNAEASIMITASHMPMNRNGLKIITKEGGLAPSDVKEILQIAEEVVVPKTLVSNTQRNNFLKEYAKDLVALVQKKSGEEKPLEGARIVVDAGNGAGGFFATDVLIPLGANVDGSRYLEPDGNFPNHIPNPEEEEAIESIIEAVNENNADLGIIFDTDVDRSAIVDEKGNPINKSAFIAFIASLLLEETPGATIVTDSVTSNGLKDFIEERGGKHYRYQRGYKNVIDKAKELNDQGIETVLAMETSGHGAVKDNYFLDDGSYLALLSLLAYIKAKKNNQTISGYLSDYKYPAAEEELRYTIYDENFREKGSEILKDFDTFVKEEPGWSLETPNYEGIRVNCDKDHGDGWVLIRQSLHEPKLVINMESDSPTGIDYMANKVKAFLDSYEILKG